jgi:hypothetical protein
LERFTAEELKATPRPVKGKILRCLAAWDGYAEVADAAVQAHQQYELNLFSGDKKKK